MYVNEGGAGYSFCPGKATWDPADNSVFRMLTVVAETGALYHAGGLSEQPSWFVDLLGWFLPRYNDLRFYSRAKAILGDGKASGPSAPNRKPSRR